MFWKYTNNKSVPSWMRLVQAFICLADGILGVLAWPFGYSSELSMWWCEKILEHMFVTGKSKQG